ncbi:hypothetical protein IT570_02265 [Candidatus Sumerlaeota bacterium]|nr:hypothetical protein [Candidatus Sumerlaeota bacterium]
MTRVLLVGVGPMPRAGLKKVHATGLRLKAFLDALLRAGCEVSIAEFPFSDRDTQFVPNNHPAVTHHVALQPRLEDPTIMIEGLVEKWDPHCIVALTDIGALAACAARFDGPIHVDYFGHPMAERQQQGAAHKNDTALADQWLHVLPVLLRADRFSVCSRDQRQALIGELGAAGRLNQHTTGYDLAEVVPPVLPFAELLTLSQPNLLIERGIPSGSRIILCSGGYNTWVDEETLFRGIEGALARDENLHFVSTGGAIEGHVENVYERFEGRVRSSAVHERMHLLGWVNEEDFENILLLSHVGVNIDFKTYEGELGCRNRLYGWLWAGMRAVTTVSSEPTRALVEQGWVTEVPFGDAGKLTTAILKEANKPREVHPQEVHQRLRQQWGGENFFSSFSQWVKKPERAPDRADGVVRNRLAELQRSFLESAEVLEKLATARELADRLSGSRAAQLYGKLHPEITALIQRLKS